MARTKRFTDLTGKRFGKYTVLSHVTAQRWLCRCDCGVEKELISTNLTRSKSPMCRDCRDKDQIIDLTGQRFGKWTAISLARPNFWNCRCDCGKEAVVSRGNLRRGGSTQCDSCRLAAMHKPKHGHCPDGKWSPTYQVWVSIKQRCLNPNETSYPPYGGQGVCMCKGWQESFPLFLKQMGERTTQHLSIDRANTDESNRHYSCGECDECKAKGWVFHCRWATRSEQMKNTSRTRWITFNGETLNLTDWSAKIGVPVPTLSLRLDKYGWSIEKALTTPRRTYNQ